MTRQERLLIVLAFAAIYIVWGTTYLAVSKAVATIPPFLMAGIRFLLAGGALYAFTLLVKKSAPPTLQQVKNAAFTGVLLLSVGVGGVAWGLQYVDSGVTALFISGQPLLTTLLVWMILKRRPVLSSYLGILLGMLGMAVLVGQEQLIGQETSLMGLTAIFFSMLCWGIGSVYVNKLDLPQMQMQSAAIQMLVAGVSLILFAGSIGEWQRFSLEAVSWSSWVALFYLIVFGSLIAFSAFNYLLKRVSPEKVSTSTYVNPVVALLLGWWLNAEVITQQSLWAAAIMLTGVLFINVDVFAEAKKKRRRLLMRRSNIKSLRNF